MDLLRPVTGTLDDYAMDARRVARDPYGSAARRDYGDWRPGVAPKATIHPGRPCG
ncbi:hypothetical protein [Streptomyces sp. NPDC002889]|uniref:hypothetical protein n=1 Tax=Streptomyces sp. NPDC002889 TaxID=3364669 RepID=UPI0036CE3339